MGDLIFLSEAQMRRIEPYFPLSHGKPRVDDRQVSTIGLMRWREKNGREQALPFHNERSNPRHSSGKGRWGSSRSGRHRRGKDNRYFEPRAQNAEGHEGEPGRRNCHGDGRRKFAVAPYRLFTNAEAAHYCRRSPAACR
jgi:hypothetical protein